MDARTHLLAVVVSACSIGACAKSDSPTSPSGSAGGTVVTAYAGSAAFVVGGILRAGTLALSVTKASPQLAFRLPSQAAGTGTGTVNGSFTTDSGTTALTGTVTGDTLTVQSSGISFTATTSDSGALSGVGTSGAQQYTVAAYATTAASTAPGEYWGKYKSRYEVFTTIPGKAENESHEELLQLTISGTRTGITNTYPVHVWAWDSTSANGPTSPNAIELTGSVTLPLTATPTALSNPIFLDDVRTRYADPRIMPIALDGTYWGSEGWRGSFSGSDQYGRTTGSWTASATSGPYRP